MNIILSHEGNIFNIKNENTYISKKEIQFLSTSKDDISSFLSLINQDTISCVLFGEAPKIEKISSEIRKKYPYLCLIWITPSYNTKYIENIDIYLHDCILSIKKEQYLETLFLNSFQHSKKFRKYRELFVQSDKIISIKDYQYDPLRRIFYYNNTQTELTQRKGDIIEILAKNINTPVSKKLILQKVWGTTDHFTSRNMDVYLSYIRNFFKENNINLQIVNVKNKGIMLK